MTAQPVAEADVLDALDWDHTPPCETVRRPCSSAATHIIEWECGCNQLLCLHCMLRWVDELAAMPTRQGWLCRDCKYEFGDGKPTDFFRVRMI